MAEWRSAANGLVPSDGVIAGMDTNGESIYIGRAWESGDLIPGKIVPSHGCLYVPYSGNEIRHCNYEYLVQPNYGRLNWLQTGDGQIAPSAVVGGQTSNGETLYIGRAYFEGSLVIGKVHPTHRVLYVPFGGREISISDYEVLFFEY